MLLRLGIIPSVDKDITILFEIRSVAQCVEHGGPDWIAIPEYVPMCLINSVISLIKDGYNITVGGY